MIRLHGISTQNKIIVWSIALAAIILGIIALLVNQPDTNQLNFPEPTAAPGPITIEGAIVCLPHKDKSGPQTLECAFGMQADSGEYYGLTNLQQDQLIDGTLTVSTKVKVSGQVTPPGQDEKYDIVGTINVTSIEVISSSVNHINPYQFNTLLFENYSQRSLLWI